MRALLLLFTLSFGAEAAAQKPLPQSPHSLASSADECKTGTARSDLDLTGVRAPLFNTGNLFWKLGEAEFGDTYEVPKGSGKMAVFSSGLWIGGTVGGDLRFAGSTYGPWEFWPGPLDANATTTPDRCTQYDRIWTVTTEDIDTYNATGAAATDLAEWPVAVGAPFYVDTDGSGRQEEGEPTVSLDLDDAGYGTRTLDLAAGERPVIFGRQTAWWVMNDAGGPHAWSGEEPLGVEVRVTAWLLGRSHDPSPNSLNTSTFYRYEIINRSADVVEETYVSLFVDADLGNFTDDYVGSDSTRSMLTFYNDDYDEGAEGYGEDPPALGIDLLSGGASAMYFSNQDPDVPTGYPQESGTEAYRSMQGLWKDGTPLRVGGDGYATEGPVTTWAYSGRAPAFWSELDTDGLGGTNPSGDRLGLVSTRIGRLGPGERDTVDVAFLFAQGYDHLNSLGRLRGVSDHAQTRYDIGMLTDQYDDPPAPSGTVYLDAPEDGADLPPGPITFSWSLVTDAMDYTLELDTDSTFSDPTRFFVLGMGQNWGIKEYEVSESDLPANVRAPIYWRVLPEVLGAQGRPSERRSYTSYRYVPTVTSLEVIANAGGPLDPPEPGAAAFAGFPTPGGGDPNESQQTNGTRWLFSTKSATSFDSFMSRTFRSESAFQSLDGSDFEMRFTGQSVAYEAFSTGAAIPVPFELWNIGLETPDDPSDDVRMIPIILDENADGTYGVSGDSPLSDGDDDPQTDRIYWHAPVDGSPGESGYLAYENGGALDREQVGQEVFARTTLVGWDLGTAPPYAADLPEPGTVFRIVVSDPLRPVDAVASPERAALSLRVGPNPVRTRASVTYLTEVAGAVRLLLVDVLGREVAVLADGPRTAGEHRAEVDAAGLAAGVYVVVLDAGDQRATRTITVVR